MEGIFSQQGLQLFARLIALFTAIPFHEAAHAFVSDKLGDPTPRLTGRLTLNPLKSIDPMGLAAMIFIGYGWAKPVQVDPRFYKNKKQGMALTAAAGPISNFILAYLSIVLYKVVLNTYVLVTLSTTVPSGLVFVLSIIRYLALINVVLGVFNLIPIPPFDGSRIFLSFLPDSLYFGIQKYERYIMIVLLLLFWFTNVGGALSGIYDWVFSGLEWSTGYIDYIFSFFIKLKI